MNTQRKTGLLKARAPGELAEEVEAYAKADGVHSSHIIREAVEQYVARRRRLKGRG